jgi:hypothetical protein
MDELLRRSSARFIKKTGSILMPLSKEQSSTTTEQNTTEKEDTSGQEQEKRRPSNSAPLSRDERRRILAENPLVINMTGKSGSKGFIITEMTKPKN